MATFTNIETVGDLLDLLRDYPTNMKLQAIDSDSDFRSTIKVVKQDKIDSSTLLLECEMEP